MFRNVFVAASLAQTSKKSFTSRRDCGNAATYLYSRNLGTSCSTCFAKVPYRDAVYVRHAFLSDGLKRSLRKSYITFPVFLFASVEEWSSKNREKAIGKTSFSKHVKIPSQNHVRCCLQKIRPCFINFSN